MPCTLQEEGVFVTDLGVQATGKVDGRGMRREQNAKKLHDAVLRLIRQNGSTDMTVTEITEHAGVSRRTLHYCYDSVDEVVAGVCRTQLSEIETALGRLLGHGATQQRTVRMLTWWLSRRAVIGVTRYIASGIALPYGTGASELFDELSALVQQYCMLEQADAMSMHTKMIVARGYAGMIVTTAAKSGDSLTIEDADKVARHITMSM